MAKSLIGGRGPECLGVSWGLAALTTVILGFRAYVKVTRKLPGTVALIWALAVWFFSVVTTILITLTVDSGWGNHAVVLKENHVVNYMWLLDAILVALSGITKGLSKIAVATYLLTWLNQRYSKRRWILHFIGVSNLILGMAVFIVAIIQVARIENGQCDPQNHVETVQEGCVIEPYLHLTYVQGPWSAASDFALAALPAYVIWPLRITKRMRAVLYFLLSLGLIAGAMAITRTWAVVLLAVPDYSYVGVTYTLTTNAETWLLLIGSSIPPCWTLIRPRLEKHLCSPNTRQNMAAGDGIQTIPVTGDSPNQAQSTQRWQVTAGSMGPSFTPNMLASLNRHQFIGSARSRNVDETEIIAEEGMPETSAESESSRNLSTVPSNVQEKSGPKSAYDLT